MHPGTDKKKSLLALKQELISLCHFYISLLHTSVSHDKGE